MNNEKILKELVKDKENNKQYFEDIIKAKKIERKVSKTFTKYMQSMQMILAMVNVKKILDLGLVIKKYNNNYKIVLTNNGVRYRYYGTYYANNSRDLDEWVFKNNIEKAIKAIFNEPEIKPLQKNKIKPLQKINFDFLKKIDFSNEFDIDIETITNDLEIIKTRTTIPRFTDSVNYGTLSKFQLLSIKSQIEQQLKEYLEERNATIALIQEKQKELEALFPLMFLFGGN